MQTAKRLIVLTAWTLTAMLLAGTASRSPALAQRGGGQQAQPQFPSPIAGQANDADKDQQSAARQNLEEKQAQARNTDRQKRLVADSDKLLQLATQLHQDVGKTDKNILSMDVVRRAAEIEKLAHDVKERMKARAPHRGAP